MISSSAGVNSAQDLAIFRDARTRPYPPYWATASSPAGPLDTGAQLVAVEKASGDVDIPRAPDGTFYEPKGVTGIGEGVIDNRGVSPDYSTPGARAALARMLRWVNAFPGIGLTFRKADTYRLDSVVANHHGLARNTTQDTGVATHASGGSTYRTHGDSARFLDGTESDGAVYLRGRALRARVRTLLAMRNLRNCVEHVTSI